MFVSSEGLICRTGSIRLQTVTSRVAKTEFFVKPRLLDPDPSRPFLTCSANNSFLLLVTRSYQKLLGKAHQTSCFSRGQVASPLTVKTPGERLKVVEGPAVSTYGTHVLNDAHT